MNPRQFIRLCFCILPLLFTTACREVLQISLSGDARYCDYAIKSGKPCSFNTDVACSDANQKNRGFAQGVAVSGKFAYLANGRDGLRIFDVSIPAKPVCIGHANDGGDARQITLSGSYAYLACGDSGLRIYDISNPAKPVSISHVRVGGWLGDVAVSGKYAYLALAGKGLDVYDVSDPARPIKMGSVPRKSRWSVIGAAVSGNFLYLSILSDRVEFWPVYDISDAAHPKYLGRYRIKNDVPDVFMATFNAVVSGQYVFHANGEDGLCIYSLPPELTGDRAATNVVIGKKMTSSSPTGYRTLPALKNSKN